MKKILITLMVASLFSCETEKIIDYDVFYQGDKIVVHGSINQEDGVNVYVKRTLAPDKVNEDDKLIDANVFLVEDDVEIVQLIRETDYLYVAPDAFEINPNAIYSVKVTSPNLQEVNSSGQEIFDPIPIDSLVYVARDYSDYVDLKIYYTNPSLDNGYYVKIYQYDEGEIIDSTDYGYIQFEPFSIIKPNLTGVQHFSYNAGFLSEFDSIQVKWYTFSPDFLTFFESINDNANTSEDPFYEYTYPVYSNIENGYGLFGSYSYDTMSVTSE